MTDEEGGFYSAEDADSEGEEGRFYVWSADELARILGRENAKSLETIFGFTDEGNFREEATGNATGNNIPYLARDPSELTEQLNLSQQELASFIEDQRRLLFEHRERRTHPLKDDKVLTDWNGLMIAALALGGSVLDDAAYTGAAEKAARFVLGTLRDGKGRLSKRYRQGVAGLPPHLDDYAFMTWGLLNLYEATFEPDHLQAAVELAEIMVSDFADEDGGGFFLGSEDGENLMVRAKDSYDGAIPSGNSAAAMDCVRLARFTGDPRWAELAEKTFKAFSDLAQQAPSGHAHLLSAFLFDRKNPKEVVVVGKRGDPDTERVLRSIRDRYFPHRVLLFKDVERSGVLDETAPWTRTHQMRHDKPTIYVCEDAACQLPTTDLSTALSTIGDRDSSGATNSDRDRRNT
jgi:uncharacterized protein YyaL (SSP411 family)